MIFSFFALGIAALFFAASVILLSHGRRPGFRYLVAEHADMTGLRTIEGAVFALIGLLVVFKRPRPATGLHPPVAPAAFGARAGNPSLTKIAPL